MSNDDSQQRGVDAFERLVRGDDTVIVRGACKKCGGMGHLTYECKNSIKIESKLSKPSARDPFADEKARLRAEIEKLKSEANSRRQAPRRSSKEARKGRRRRSPSFSSSESSGSSGSSSSGSEASDSESSESPERRKKRSDRAKRRLSSSPRRDPDCHRRRHRRSRSPSDSGSSRSPSPRRKAQSKRATK